MWRTIRLVELLRRRAASSVGRCQRIGVLLRSLHEKGILLQGKGTVWRGRAS